MTDEVKREFISAAKALLLHLKTSTDEETVLFSSHLKESAAQRLRRRADEVEAEEAAIWRFRKAAADLSAQELDR